MASPKIEVIAVYSATTGSPLTGQTLTFDTYKDDLGVNVSQPTITEIGGGFYKFTPVFASPNRGIAYIVNTGAGATPERVARFMRPEDWNTDSLAFLTQYESGKWEIKTTGPDANRLIIYDADGTTVLIKYDLFDNVGAPTSTNPFKRVPVP